MWGVKFNKFQSMSRFSTMCNYFSIGADAKASKLFENHRTSKPGLYRSQSFNKASYAAFGGFLALKGSSSVGKRIRRLVVDGPQEESSGSRTLGPGSLGRLRWKVGTPPCGRRAV